MEITKALEFVDLNKMGINQALKLYKKNTSPAPTGEVNSEHT